MKRKLLVIAVLMVTSLALAAPAAAQGPPSLPHYFYGTVKINNTAAPAGTVIEARVAGVISGSFNPITITEAGKYGSADPLANVPRLLVQGNIFDGDTVEFYVNGARANETAPWHSGQIQMLNLTVATGPAGLSAAFSGTPVSGAAPLAVQFSDESAGAVTGWLWDFGDGQTGSAQNPAHNYTNNGLYTVSLTVTDGVNSHTARRIDYIKVGGTEVTRATTLPAGWNMMSLPLAPQDSNFNSVLGDDITSGLYIYWYNPVSGSYQMWSGSTPVYFAERGRGYWVKAQSPTPIDATGYVAQGQAFTIHLNPGWNMIGSPFDTVAAWNNVLVKRLGSTVSILQAHSNNWVLKFLYSYDPATGSYTIAAAPDGQLSPWRGYWVRSLVEADLIVPAP